MRSLVKELPSVLTQMGSPEALQLVIDHIILQIELAQKNGRTVTFESHALDKAGGNVDHHGTTTEPRWGLYCASLMAAIAKYLEITDGLSVLEDEKPDADQRLAYKIMTLALPQIEQVLEQEMAVLFQEEFACFCEDCQPDPERLSRIEDKFVDVQILWREQAVPVAIVQYNNRMLPFENGDWNHIVALKVKERLAELGIGKTIKSGILTVIIHGDKIKNPQKGHRLSWQRVIPSRIVAGIVAVNELAWSDQFSILADAIAAHEKMSEIVHLLYEPKICRNLLITANTPKVKRQRLPEPRSQYGLRRLMRVLKLHGYELIN